MNFQSSIKTLKKTYSESHDGEKWNGHLLYLSINQSHILRCDGRMPSWQLIFLYGLHESVKKTLRIESLT